MVVVLTVVALVVFFNILSSNVSCVHLTIVAVFSRDAASNGVKKRKN